MDILQPVFSGIIFLFLVIFLAKHLGETSRKKRYVSWIYLKFIKENGLVPRFEYESRALGWCHELVNKYDSGYPGILFPPRDRYRKSHRSARRLLHYFISEGDISNNLIKDDEDIHPGRKTAKELHIVRHKK